MNDLLKLEIEIPQDGLLACTIKQGNGEVTRWEELTADEKKRVVNALYRFTQLFGKTIQDT